MALCRSKLNYDNKEGGSVFNLYTLKGLMEKPAISVLVISFNAKAALPHCVDSLLKQNFEDFEVLILAPKPLQTNSEKVRFIKPKNNFNVAQNFQRLLTKANGSKVLFLNENDELAVNCLQAMNNVAENSKSNMISSKAELIVGANDQRIPIRQNNIVVDAMIQGFLGIRGVLIAKDFLMPWKECGSLETSFSRAAIFLNLLKSTKNYVNIEEVLYRARLQTFYNEALNVKTVLEDLEHFNQVISLYPKEDFQKFYEGIFDIFLKQDLKAEQVAEFQNILKNTLKFPNISPITRELLNASIKSLTDSNSYLPNNRVSEDKEYYEAIEPEIWAFNQKRLMTEKLAKLAPKDLEEATKQDWYAEYLTLLPIKLTLPSLVAMSEDYCNNLFKWYTQHRNDERRHFAILSMMLFKPAEEIPAPVEPYLWPEQMKADIRNIFIEMAFADSLREAEV